MKRGLYITLVIGIAAQVYYFFNLPDSVANHFGSNGIPNGWMSRNSNGLVSSAILSFNSALFLSVTFIFEKVPVRYISFPKKNYWLAPERKEQSIKTMSDWLFFFGIVTNVFLIAVSQLIYLANQLNPPRLDNQLFIFILVIYFFILSGWLFFLYKRFNSITPSSTNVS